MRAKEKANKEEEWGNKDVEDRDDVNGVMGEERSDRSNRVKESLMNAQDEVVED